MKCACDRLSKIISKNALFHLCLILLFPVTITTFAGQHAHAQASGSAFPSVKGTQLIDSSGLPFLLRGAQIESSFNYMKGWQNNNNVTNKLNPTVFHQMSSVWHMNVLRLPTSNCIYLSNPTHYLNLLDQIVQQANQAGLYVIIDLHDDQQSGSPYGSGADVPKPETIDYWKTIATHSLNNTQVMFDVFNEPQYPDANTWLNGGGTMSSNGKTAAIIGMQVLVNAIRSTGAQQIIIIGEMNVAGNLRINDPNIVYTKHVYHEVSSGNPTTWDALWGTFKGQYPLYFGEWALLPNASDGYKCQGTTQANADQKVIDFMNYIDQNNISWTAWQFANPELILNHTSFTPTSLDDPNNPWVCNSPTSTAGMGTLVYLHLLSLATGGNLTESGNFNGATASVQLNGHDQQASYTLTVLATNMQALALVGI